MYPQTASQECMGGTGGVSLVLLGVLHLTHTDSLSLTQTHILVIVSLILTQIHSISFRFVQIHSLVSPRSTQPHSDLLWLTPILAISLRFALTRSDSCNFVQICSASCRFTQIRSDSHSDSPDLIQTCSDPSRRTRIQSDPHSFTPAFFAASLRLI